MQYVIYTVTTITTISINYHLKVWGQINTFIQHDCIKLIKSDKDFFETNIMVSTKKSQKCFLSSKSAY